MNKFELLAPAGNKESFYCALNSGADAIYLGLGDFNARGNIENFNFESLRECVKDAHLFGVKIYLTLNILFLDNELDKILSIVRKALDIKVDAFIIQDVGLAYLLKKTFPEIELHASTQMGVSNLEGAKVLANLGFKRIVLARETLLAEVKRIHDNLDLELEYFIQGALCVSYSGNCYLCSLLANSSGNRGKCKQFCRLPFKMESKDQTKDGYFLSTKDLCMLPRLKQLAECGITSFKIEGRARRPAYVAGAVQVYRKAIDNNFEYDENSILMLKKLFNRGDFIKGYFEDENIIYNKTQNHIGVKIGRVLSFKKGNRFNEVVVESNHEIKKGDALKFFVDGREDSSVSVQDIKNIGKNKFVFTTTSYIKINASMHLIVDAEMETEIVEKRKKLKVSALFEGKIGKPATLTLSLNGLSIKAQSQSILEEAKAQPLTTEECCLQISKMGKEFEMGSFVGNIENVFMAKSQLNQLRRDALEKLKEKLIQKHEENKLVKEQKTNLNKNDTIIKNDKKIIYFSSLSTLEKYIESKDYLVYNPECYNKEEIKDFCNRHANKTIYLALPVIAEENDIFAIKEYLQEISNLGIVANNYYALNLTTPNKTIVGSNMNVTNSWSIKFYSDLGFDKIILTKENFDIQDIKTFESQVFVETNIRKTLMHFRHCPFKENIGGDCRNCKYQLGVNYKLNDKTFVIKRKRIFSCQFEMIENCPSTINPTKFGQVIEIL